jgi:hypothetical protein
VSEAIGIAALTSFVVGTWSAPRVKTRYSAKNRATSKTLNLQGNPQAMTMRGEL